MPKRIRPKLASSGQKQRSHTEGVDGLKVIISGYGCWIVETQPVKKGPASQQFMES